MQRQRHHRITGFKKDKIQIFKNEGKDPVPLLIFLEKNLIGKSRTDIKSYLKHRQVKIDGDITTKFDAIVEPGMEVSVNYSRSFVELRNPRVKLIYEDDDIIVIEKGYGLLSVSAPGSKKEPSAYDIVREYIKLQNPSNKLFVVHRLDRDTTGLMMFAKNEESMETLRHNWNNFVLERLYVALLEGYVEKDSGYIKSRLTENSQYKVYSVEDGEEGKIAVTHYKVLKRGHGLSLVEFSLDTGRKNQIRVHASEMGHPISGDRKYGGKTSKIGRLCLHARTLRFAHPVTKKDMYFETPVPSRFLKII